MPTVLRPVIALVVLVMLVRAGRHAWRGREVARAVWSAIRPRHVAGSLALLVAVVGVAVLLVTVLPVTGLGLGSLAGLTGNAVFAPVEQVTAGSGGLAGGASGESGRALATTAAVLGFLGLLLLLFPWLAYVEERAFRMGLEGADLPRQIWVALRFGLLHLVMLIPVAAALAIAVAGFVYGRIYRRAYRQAAAVEPSAVIARREAVLASTVWHATFNSTVVVLFAAAYVLHAA